MKKISLRFKLTASFLALSLVLLLTVSALANLFFYRQFNQYVKSRLVQQSGDLVALVSKEYENGLFNVSGIESIGLGALGDGLILRVTDNKGTPVWDAKVHNSGMCAAILADMAKKMSSSPGFNGEYVEKVYPVTVDGQTVGSAAVGYYGPFFYSDTDVAFLDTLNRLFLLTALFAAGVSLLLGTYLARRLSKPIARAVAVSRRIADGDLEVRIEDRADTRETAELTESVNSLADSLQEQEALRRRLTSDVAHELRTPVATLQTHLEAMIDGVWSPDTKRLQSCHEETVRLGNLVGELEKLTAAEGETLRLEKSEVELLTLLRSIVTNSEAEYRKKGVTLHLDGVPATVLGDAVKLGSVFVNLLSNALKYTPSGGSVAVTVDKTETCATVTVRDTGVGIAKEDLPHIFERFYRADKSRTRQTGGFGIGLAIVKSVVAAHGGTVFVESEPDRGSVFTVILTNIRI